MDTWQFKQHLTESTIYNIHFTLEQITLIMKDKGITASRSFIIRTNIYPVHNKIRLYCF